MSNNIKESQPERPIIISASRRTDIPANFGDWFMHKVAQGGLEVPNPFNNKTYFVPLKPETTAAIVFWSKNYKPFLDKLSLLEKRGFDKFVFNFTITGHPREFEPGIPPADETIADFKYLSLRYWKSTVFWRFDPVLISNITNEEYHLDTFRRLADQIALYTERCIFSFTYFYNKVKRSLKQLNDKTGIQTVDPEIDRKRALALKLAMIAQEYQLKLHSCCCEYLEDLPGIEKSRCIDGELISRLWKNKYRFEVKPSRPGCGCAESYDIGSYGTCKNGCVYCYAN